MGINEGWNNNLDPTFSRANLLSGPIFYKNSHLRPGVPIFYSKYIVTGKISPIGKMEKKRLFWVGGKAPWRADDSTDLKVGPGSILS